MDAETKEIITRAQIPKVFLHIRKALGLSQEKMSELTGISRVQVSYYETANTVPSMATFNKWLFAVTEEIKKSKNGWGKNARKKS